MGQVDGKTFLLLGYRCYLTVTERSYLTQLVERDKRGRSYLKKSILDKLEELFPDEPSKEIEESE